MASFPKEHNTLYFDALIRTQKKESVLAFIMATYYAKKNNNEDKVKDDLYKRLEYAYGLFRDNIRGYDNGVGSYAGTDDQFSSQYTLGLEMGIWKNSKLDLNDLALKVAKNEITITEYFDVVLLNYIQPVNGKIIHPLFQILNYIKNTNSKSIQKSDFFKALELNDEGSSEAINALYNILIGTSYFNDNNNTLILSEKYNINGLISRCNKKYLGEDGYAKAKTELEPNDEKYIEYLISINDEIPSDEEISSEIEIEEQIEDRKSRFKKWLTDLGRFTSNTIRNYVYYINYIKKHGYTDLDLYTITDISVIEELIDKFTNDEDYVTWNRYNRYTPSNALTTYKEFLSDEKNIFNNIENECDNDLKEIILDDPNRAIGGTNIIYYGAPGCGKSIKVRKIIDKEKFEDIRTIFYSDYTNGEFVGQVVPKVDKKGKIYYEIEPGYFTRILFDAMIHPTQKYCLVIEEINRGNAPAIFGDIFQLLDRNKKGTSEFEISNDIINQYFNNNGYKLENDKIKIPSNLWIKATMNTSDQNVYTLDTAFKRRWKLEKLTNKFDSNEPYDNKIKSMLIPGSKDVTWEEFIDKINSAIFEKNSYGVNAEDKQLGKYFVGTDSLVNEDGTLDTYTNLYEAKKAFSEKVLMYLWDDVAKLNRDLWFNPDYKTLDELLVGFDDKGLLIFNDLFKKDNEAEMDTYE